jgi:hypothetical protein
MSPEMYPISLITSRTTSGIVDVGLRGDFAGDDRHAGGDHGLDGDAGELILRQHRVEDGVGDLVGDLVRMAHADGF